MRNIMKNIIFTIFAVTIIGIIIFSISRQRTNTNQPTLVPKPTSEPISYADKPPDKPIVVTINKNDIYIKPNEIDINPGIESANPKSIRIDSDHYPELFKKDCTRLRVEGLDVPRDSSLKLIYISCQRFANAWDYDSYAITIDPSVPKVISSESVPYIPNGLGVYINNACMSCLYQILEFNEYDPIQHQFVIANNKHRKEFTELLKHYEQRMKKETCRIYGKDMTLEEAFRVANENDKCADLLMGPSSNRPPDESFITIGQYRTILNNIKRVINGENIKIFDWI